jgi:hypothetical protein
MGARSAVAINGGSLTPIDFVEFGTPSLDNGSVQLELDVWVLPFLNVYVSDAS